MIVSRKAFGQLAQWSTYHHGILKNVQIIEYERNKKSLTEKEEKTANTASLS